MNRNIFSETDHFLSGDWGTSSFRLHLVHRESGRSLERVEDSGGIRTVGSDVINASAAEKRQKFTAYLKSRITELEQRTSRGLEGVPVVLSGMITSSIGWRELDYSPLPVDLRRPDLKMDMMPADRDFEHPVLLISGIRSEDDVMRGEEMELIGLHDLQSRQSSSTRSSSGRASGGAASEKGSGERAISRPTLYLLPGTHSKHLLVTGDVLTRFHTYVTGELFNLIASESLIRHSVSTPTPANAAADTPAPSFAEGVQAALEFNLLNRLFSLRARDLLTKTSGEDNFEYLSGLMIGTELRDLKQRYADVVPEVILAGNSQLQSRYAAALGVSGISCTLSTPSDYPVVAGHCLVLNRFSILAAPHG